MSKRLTTLDVLPEDYALQEHKWVTSYFNDSFEDVGPRPVEIQPSSVKPLRSVEQHALILSRQEKVTQAAQKLVKYLG